MDIRMEFGKYRFTDVWRSEIGEIPFWDMGGRGDEMKILCALEKGRTLNTLRFSYPAELIIREGTGVFIFGENFLRYKPYSLVTLDAQVAFVFERVETDTIFIMAGLKQKQFKKTLCLPERRTP